MTKSAFITIAGKPNVGKSSLLNRLVGEKIAIVSAKPQTTRTKILGVITKGETQLVFIDTPGVHKPKTKLSTHMNKAISESVAEVDAVLFVAEPKDRLDEVELSLLNGLNSKKQRVILAINKVDTLKNKEKLLGMITSLNAQFPFSDTLLVSALTGDGLQELFDALLQGAAPSPHFFPDDTLTDQPERVIVAEIVREKVLRNLHDEIPHGIAVTVENMKTKQGTMHMDVTIYVEKQSHKGMVIGKGGAMLKKIMSEARLDCEQFLSCKVNMVTWVKVKEDWRNIESVIKSLGLSQ